MVVALWDEWENLWDGWKNSVFDTVLRTLKMSRLIHIGYG